LSIPAFLATTADVLAQVPASGPTTTQPAPAWARFVQSFGGLMPIILVMVLFIWMTSRSRKKQEQQKQSMLSAMKRGDKIQTIGGILGNVVEVRDDRILVKIDEGNNTKVWFARSAIHRVLGEEAEAK
jgi:preprotein translocase subunit YajC